MNDLHTTAGQKATQQLSKIATFPLRTPRPAPIPQKPGRFQTNSPTQTKSIKKITPQNSTQGLILKILKILLYVCTIE